MKNTIYTLLIILAFLSCKAQTPIIDIDDRDQELVDGSYLKDVHHELDKFVGTWLYTNGNTSLKIKFEKKLLVESAIYADILVGEYRYVQNGVELINTLPNFDNQTFLEHPYKHNLTGSLIIYKYEFPGCTNCTITEKRVKISVSDPTPNRQYLSATMYMGIRYINSAIPKMQIDFDLKGTMSKPDGAPSEPSIPLGRYVLIKQ